MIYEGIPSYLKQKERKPLLYVNSDCGCGNIKAELITYNISTEHDKLEKNTSIGTEKGIVKVDHKKGAKVFNHFFHR